MLKTSRRSMAPRGKALRNAKPLPPPAPPRPSEPATEGPPVRQWLVDQVREEIRQGSYDEDQKLDALLDRLAEDLGVTVEDEQPAKTH